jgi:hypothetical protein
MGLAGLTVCASVESFSHTDMSATEILLPPGVRLPKGNYRPPPLRDLRVDDDGYHGSPTQPADDPDFEWPPVKLLLVRYRAALTGLRNAHAHAKAELDEARRLGITGDLLREVMVVESLTRVEVISIERAVTGLENPDCPHWTEDLGRCTCEGGRRRRPRKKQKRRQQRAV